MNPLISIIVPIYKAENYLPKCIDNLLKQTYPNFEIILVDDGSPDNSPYICDKYASLDTRIHVIHKTNGGVSSARNIGIKNAKGKWIGFVDCDDVPKSNMYLKLVEAAELYNCDFAMGSYEKKEDNRSFPISLHYNGLIEEKDVKKIIYSMAFWNGYFDEEYLPTVYGSVWPNIYKADIIQNNSILFPEDVIIGEDLLFNISYLQYVRKIIVINEPLYEYNIMNISATRKCNPELWNHYIILNKRINNMLISIYGKDNTIIYNVYKQYISYAINVIEEQILVFLKEKDRNDALCSLCNNQYLQEASFYIMKYGKNVKEKIQAWIFFKKHISLIKLWLDRK